MSDWVGFTDEDLHRLQNGDGVVKERPKIVKPIAKRTMQGNNNKTNLLQEKSAVRKSTPNKNKQQQVSSAALLSKPTAAKTEKKPEPKPEETIPDIKEMEQNMEKPTQKDNGIVLDDEIGKKKEKLKLEDAQQRQKQMEEMNRRKKAMLTKEIAERKKRAIAESSKLVKIQTELTKLDQLLNVDVSILRDQIDEACWEFSQAQRRFQQAEKEYIASKMDLHEKTTRKEDLTEHLFNIIQANEERKAKKLEELMLKLNLEEEELELREQERKEKEEKK
uniref:RAB6-interacting golgin n=1 Tax=Ciona intestinalis TaxID=7719 RepID=F7B2D4_CIOIN